MIQALFVGRNLHAKLAGIVSLALFTLAGLGVSAQAPKAAGEPSLADILGRAGQYVHQFEQDFAVVICDEDYRQDDHPRRSDPRGSNRGKRELSTAAASAEGGPTHRETRSEMLFVRSEQDAMWLAVRNVLIVRDSGATFPVEVSGSQGSIDRALRDESPGQASRLRALADEGARFNLGGIYRNFNIPTLALQFLAPEFQPRFTFRLAGREKLSGNQAVKLEFAERGAPTVIALNNGHQLVSTGLLWVRESDGAVLRTRLAVKAPQTDDGPGIDGTINVSYGWNAKLKMWVPSKMEERYTENRQPGEKIECYATYSNFRRFETGARLVEPK